MKKLSFFALITVSLFLNIYLYSKPEIECSINKEELFSKINTLDENELGEKYSGKLLLLLLAELGLKNKITIDPLPPHIEECENKVIERVVTKEVPKEVIKTIIQKEQRQLSFMKKGLTVFPRMNFDETSVEEIYKDSYLSIFLDDRLSSIQEGTYIIEHLKDNQAYETLEIKHSFQYKDKIWKGDFESIIKRGNEKILSKLNTKNYNSKIFSVTSIYNTLIWKQKDYKVLMWISKKEHGRHNGVIFKRNDQGLYKKYGNLALQTY